MTQPDRILDRNRLLGPASHDLVKQAERDKTDAAAGRRPYEPDTSLPPTGTGVTPAQENIIATRGVFYATVVSYDRTTHTVTVDLADATRVTAPCYASRAVVAGEQVACEYLTGSVTDFVVTGARG